MDDSLSALLVLTWTIFGLWGFCQYLKWYGEKSHYIIYCAICGPIVPLVLTTHRRLIRGER